MAYKSIPWGGTGGHGGPYSDDQWIEMHRLLFGTAGFSPRGILSSDVDNDMRVTQRGAGANMSVDVKAGAALINGRVVYSDTTVNLAVASAHATLNRIDLVVGRTDVSAKTFALAVKTGTPASSPTPPTLDTSNSPYYEIPLAQVYVGAGVSSITNANITDLRSPSQVLTRSYAVVTNRSGGTLYPGQVVIWDTTNARSITTTTTADDYRVAGVVADQIANLGSGRICTQGLCYVDVTATTPTAAVLTTSATAGKAKPGGRNAFGVALTTVVSSEPMLAMVNVKPRYGYFGMLEGKWVMNTTSSSWTDMTSLSLTATTNAFGPLLVSYEIPLQLTGTPSSTVTYFAHLDVNVGGSRYTELKFPGDTDGCCVIPLAAPAVGGETFAKMRRATGSVLIDPDTSFSSRVIKMQWKLVGSGGTPQLSTSGHLVRFTVEEVFG